MKWKMCEIKAEYIVLSLHFHKTIYSDYIAMQNVTESQHMTSKLHLDFHF